MKATFPGTPARDKKENGNCQPINPAVYRRVLHNAVTNARLLRSTGLRSPHLPLDHARSTAQPRARHKRITLRKRARFRWELGSGAPLLPPSLSSPLRNRSASVANIPPEAPAAASVAAINPTEILEVSG